jgi:hypothetical protein
MPVEPRAKTSWQKQTNCSKGKQLGGWLRVNDPQTRRGAAKDAKDPKISVADAQGQPIPTLRGKGGERMKKPPVCPTRCSTEIGNAKEKQIEGACARVLTA